MTELNEVTKILCCTDFSSNALKSFRFAVNAAAHRENCELFLLHVIPEPDSQFWKSYIYQSDLNIDDQAKRDIDQKIDAEYRPLVPAGVKFTPVFRIGRDYEKILEFANEIEASFIVIGRQGKNSTPLRSFFFGNVAERVVGKASCPVLVVPNVSQ